jgi:hypothetical protein
MIAKSYKGIGCGVLLMAALVFGAEALAVNSKVVRQGTGAVLEKGEVKNVVVSTTGRIQLGRAAQVLADSADDIWAINAMATSGGTLYVGTSPNGAIYRYGAGELVKIYPVDNDANSGTPAADPNDKGDGKKVDDEEYLANEHIFAMGVDISGRLLAGISGEKCRLLRYDKGRMQTVLEPEDAKYIFAIVTDESGNIYLGTGPEGNIYKLDSLAGEGRVLYKAGDKNILALAADGQALYAGSDGRGLVYKIDTESGKASVLYDSDQDEITALMVGPDHEVYAAGTSAKMVAAQVKFAKQAAGAGRPESKEEGGKQMGEEGGLRLKVAYTESDEKKNGSQRNPSSSSSRKPGEASSVYKITPDGFVTDVFSEAAVLYSIAGEKGSLLVGTGNKAELFSIEPKREEESVVYKDDQSEQITSLVVSDADIYVGTANPAKLVKLGEEFATEGSYSSDLIDAEQPAMWGKLQVEADIPSGCGLEMSCRSGNVKDVNDSTFSDWTQPVEVKGATDLTCPAGRFCQYKLILTSYGQKTPVVREVAVAHVVPNLAPTVESVSVSRLDAPDKKGVFKISYKAKDDNGDKLVYKIDMRRLGWGTWIEVKNKLEAENFEWDGRTVEDGRYEIRVTVSDERDNSPATKLTGSRVSDPLIADNTGPVFTKSTLKKDGSSATLTLVLTDELSAIGKVEYTVDSGDEWEGSLPNDLVFDTVEESFAIEIKDLKAGEHIITVKAADAVGNTTYKSWSL